jgi:hypothetical protein
LFFFVAEPHDELPDAAVVDLGNQQPRPEERHGVGEQVAPVFVPGVLAETPPADTGVALNPVLLIRRERRRALYRGQPVARLLVALALQCAGVVVGAR